MVVACFEILFQDLPVGTGEKHEEILSARIAEIRILNLHFVRSVLMRVEALLLFA
jgi:hypothetical protein